MQQSAPEFDAKTAEGGRESYQTAARFDRKGACQRRGQQLNHGFDLRLMI
jgi:hypothetical protein